MPLYWLRNYYHASRQIRFDSDTFQFTHHDAADMDPSELTFRAGAWVEEGGRIYGISPSPDGPVFFSGNQGYRLRPGCFQVHFEEGSGDEKFFRLTVDGEVAVSLRYTPDPIETFDIYEGKANEFFEAMSYRLKKPNLYPVFTDES